MVTSTINQLSLSWITFILMSPFLLTAQGQEKKNETLTGDMITAWVSNCFVQGFGEFNSTQTECELLELPKNLIVVPELRANCHGLYKHGCQMAKLERFCEMGISKIISDTEFSCNDIEIDEDITNQAFECCISCKGGISDGSLNDKCLISNNDIPGRARQTCCKVAVNRQNESTNASSTTGSTLLPSSEIISIDEISRIVSENDDRIDLSLANLLGKNSSDSVTLNTTGMDNSLSVLSVAPDAVDLSSKVELNISSTTVQPTTTEVESTTPDLTTPTPEPTSSTPEPTSSTLVSTETVSPSSTTSTAATRAIICDTGFEKVSFFSDECIDIDECDNDDPCPDSKCYNFPGSFKCCPHGQEFDLETKECVYSDYCSKDPCFQSADDQHWCVNYFTGRECIDKIPEGYKFLKGEEGVLELIDKEDNYSPRYLELTVKNITLQEKPFKNHGLIYVHLPKDVQCDWDFKLEEIWAPNVDDKISKDQLITKTSQSEKFNQIKVWLSGQVKPQSIATSITCSGHSKTFYTNKVYFTFQPKSNN